VAVEKEIHTRLRKIQPISSWSVEGEIAKFREWSRQKAYAGEKSEVSGVSIKHSGDASVVLGGFARWVNDFATKKSDLCPESKVEKIMTSLFGGWSRGWWNTREVRIQIVGFAGEILRWGGENSGVGFWKKKKEKKGKKNTGGGVISVFRADMCGA
jgi:hypothetical protein